MGVALPYRPVESGRESVGVSSPLRRAVRCGYFFFAIICPAASHSAIFVLSLHRSALGEEQGPAGFIRAEGMRRFRNRPQAPHRDAGFALRPPERSGGGGAGLQTREEIRRLPTGAGGR